MTFIEGEWVRLPREMGHAEGIVKGDRKLWLQDDEDDFAWYVFIPQLYRHVLCPESWLILIEVPKDYPDAPKWNPTSEGHPMVERQKEEVDLVLAYIRKIEFGMTEQNCWCPWTPMEVEGKKGRLRSGEHPQCPVHTKEGFIFGFIDHVRRTFKGTQTGEFLGIDANPDAGYGVPEYGGPEKPIETIETKQAGARFL